MKIIKKAKNHIIFEIEGNTLAVNAYGLLLSVLKLENGKNWFSFANSYQENLIKSDVRQFCLDLLKKHNIELKHE